MLKRVSNLRLTYPTIPSFGVRLGATVGAAAFVGAMETDNEATATPLAVARPETEPRHDGFLALAHGEDGRRVAHSYLRTDYASRGGTDDQRPDAGRKVHGP